MTLNAHKRGEFRRARRLTVRLNGVLAPDVFYADGRRGVVREYVRNAEGRFFVAGDGNVARRERRGHVTWHRLE